MWHNCAYQMVDNLVQFFAILLNQTTLRKIVDFNTARLAENKVASIWF